MELQADLHRSPALGEFTSKTKSALSCSISSDDRGTPRADLSRTPMLYEIGIRKVGGMEIEKINK